MYIDGVLQRRAAGTWKNTGGFAGRGGLVLLVQKLLAGERLHVHLEKRSKERARRRAWNICLETRTGELVPRGTCDIATNVSGSPWKGNVLGIFAWKKGQGSWCHGGLQYCCQRFGEPWEGERACNICLEKGTGELVPRGACDIATNISRSFGKGRMLGTLSRRSSLLHMLCERWQKAKNAVKHFG